VRHDEIRDVILRVDLNGSPVDSGAVTRLTNNTGEDEAAI
jgi:hypothetical protein